MSLAGDATRDRTTQIRRVLWGILIANLGVVAAKFAIGLASHSLAVLGDAVHSSADALNNVLALGVIRVAAREPDEDHPYGHDKFETLGALAIVVFLSVSGFELVKGAVTRLWTGPQPLAVTTTQLGILAATLAINGLVALYEARRGHQLHSDLLLADAGHTRADVLITTGVLAGVLISRAGVPYVDPIVALLVTAAILGVAYGIVRRTVPVLVDEHAVPAGVIRQAAEGVAGVRSAYQIRSRGAPHIRFAEVTIAVNGAASVEDAHQIANAVESRLRQDLQLHEVVVHVEPC